MSTSRWRSVVAGALALALAAAPSAADRIRVQSTTDTVDAGLVDGYAGMAGITTLFERWEAAQGLPADSLRYVGTGTGKALENARGGQADVVITHAPSLEAEFVKDGYSRERFGRALFFSDYVVLGPQDDPAGVLAAAQHDAVSAFERIAIAGGRGRAAFVSRDDNSGTDVKEQQIWAMTGARVAKQPAENARGDHGRSTPVGAKGPGSYPPWYQRTGKGQALNVQAADACTGAGANAERGCYTITDRGTFEKLVASETLTRLKVVSDRNAATARGGPDLLVNPFSAYVVDPAARLPSGAPRPNAAAATRFVDFLTSRSFQDAVNVFPTAAGAPFHADAFPALSATPPMSAAEGSTVPLILTFMSRLPGGGPIEGLPVHLERSVDGGSTFSDAGPRALTDRRGRVRFTPKIPATTVLRAEVPRYRQFSPTTVTVGEIAVYKPTISPTVGP